MATTSNEQAQDRATTADIAAALAALQPSTRVRKQDIFHEHYPQIEAALTRNVTHAAVRATLKEMGLSLSAATFRKLLDAERNLGKPTHNGQEQSAGGAV